MITRTGASFLSSRKFDAARYSKALRAAPPSAHWKPPGSSYEETPLAMILRAQVILFIRGVAEEVTARTNEYRGERGSTLKGTWANRFAERGLRLPQPELRSLPLASVVFSAASTVTLTAVSVRSTSSLASTVTERLKIDIHGRLDRLSAFEELGFARARWNETTLVSSSVSMVISLLLRSLSLP